MNLLCDAIAGVYSALANCFGRSDFRKGMRELRRLSEELPAGKAKPNGKKKKKGKKNRPSQNLAQVIRIY